MSKELIIKDKKVPIPNMPWELVYGNRDEELTAQSETKSTFITGESVLVNGSPFKVVNSLKELMYDSSTSGKIVSLPQFKSCALSEAFK
jgi:hypothetical protein